MIDSHCHINDDLYKNEPIKYIEEANKEGVFSFLVVGSNLEDSKIALEIALNNENCFAAVGIHPSDVKKYSNDVFKTIEELGKNKKVIAIGEIGLDYYWDKDLKIREEQKNAFIEQIEIANRLNLPISIHCRDAIEDCLLILKNHKVNKGGVLHCYSGSYEMALEFIKLGFLLGFGGTTTFKNSVKSKEIVSKIPEESILLETDAPYLTPEPYRGKPNHSKYLKYIRNQIAVLRNVSPEEIDRITTKNFERLFLNETKN